MINNLFKGIKDYAGYGNLFLERIPEDTKQVLLVCIGNYETLSRILLTRQSTEFTIIDGFDSIIEYIEETKEIFPNLKRTIPIQSEDEKDLPKELESIFKTLDIENMLIIMNPPFGSNNYIISKILNTLIRNFEYKQCICLGTSNAFKNFTNYIEAFNYIQEGLFENVNIENLSVVNLSSTSLNKLTFNEIVLNEKESTLIKSIKNYNKARKTFRFGLKVCNRANIFDKYQKPLQDSFSKNLPESFLTKFGKFSLKDLNDRGCLFYTTIRNATDGVHYLESSIDRKLNLNKEELSTDLLKELKIRIHVFETHEFRNNFCNWWYACTITKNKKVDW